MSTFNRFFLALIALLCASLAQADGISNSGCSNCGSAAFQNYTATTWTPTITTDATPGTPTYTLQVGSYEVIGRQVTARFWVAASGWTGSPTGTQVQIGGLPLTSANVANHAGVCTIANYAAVLPGSNFGVQAFILPNTSVAVLQGQGGTGSAALLPSSNSPAVALQFIGVCNYHI